MLPERGDHERTTFPRLARERRLAGFPIPQGAYWRAIDTAKDLTEAAKELGSSGN
jgi:NDP-sugar pyrophosphorylase family protein